MSTDIRFFLGANSKDGFVGYFNQLQRQNNAMQLLILKGGPGSGKSSLMRKVLSAAENRCHTVEAIACASDPDSLDAVIDHTASFAIMDGTAPHTEDPLIPGAAQHIFCTGDFWDAEKLSREREKIESISHETSLCHRSATAYISAASSLLSENIYITGNALNHKNIASFVQKVTEKLRGGTYKQSIKRLLSAVTVGEIKLFSETPFYFADKVYVIDDPFGAASAFILEKLACAAELLGEKTIFCPCSVMPGKCDHLIFPDSRIAVVTQNKFMKFNGGDNISSTNFYSTISRTDDIVRRTEDASHLLSEGCRLVKKAKKHHDELEDFYVEAMDFNKAVSAFESTLKRFYC